MTVPDAIDPIVGWRTWRLCDTPDGLRLVSAARPTRWPERRPLSARCGLADHAPPAPDCTCGVYAARDPTLPLEYLPPHDRASAAFRTPAILGYDTVMALGRVELWGRIVVCEWGWRGELAYPGELLVPAGVKHYRRQAGRLTILDSAALASALADVYDISVAVTDSARADDLLARTAA